MSERRAYFAGIAALFASEALPTVADVEAMDSDLAAFGTYLLENRPTLTVVATNLAMTGLTALSSPDRIELWDNLIYYSITNKSPYVLQAINRILLADHFVSKSGSISATDDMYRKLAKSRIAHSESIMGLDFSWKTESELGYNPSNNINRNLLSSEINAAKLAIKSKAALDAGEEIDNYQRDFYNAVRSQYSSAVADYESDNLTILGAIETSIVVDEATGLSVEVYNETPVYALNAFAPEPQVAQDSLETALSGASCHIIEEMNLYSTNSLNELKGALNSASSRLFDAAAEALDINPSSYRTYSTTINYGETYSYMLSLYKRHSNNYGILLAVVMPDEVSDFSATSLYITTPVTFSALESSLQTDGRVYLLNFTPPNGISLSDAATSIAISGELNLMGGGTLSYNLTLANVNVSHVAIMSESNVSGQTQLNYVPNGFGIRRLGITDYTRIEQSLCCYLPGEVSHIENIVGREYKERSTRRLRTNEDTTVSSSENSSENQTDTVSTDRFEMQNAISEILSKDTSFGIQAGLSGDIPTVGAFDLSSDYAVNTSKENSNSQA